MRIASAPNHAPVAADSAAGRKGWRSQTKGESRKRTEESLLSSGRFRLSPATGGGSAAFQFYQLGFYVARSLLWYFPCTPRATALRQARVSGGNLQNCAPSAACGGAMTQESTVSSRSPSPPFRAAGTPWAARHARAALRSAAPSRRHPCPAGRGFRGC